MTETLIDRIKRHEGFTPVPRPDAKGMYVVGWGHDIPASSAKIFAAGIPEPLADQFLTRDIAEAQNEIAKDLPWTSELSPTRRDVLTEMVYQLGMDGLLGFHNLLYRLRSGDFAGAAQAMLASLWHEQTPGRCEELAALMIGGG